MAESYLKTKEIAREELKAGLTSKSTTFDIGNCPPQELDKALQKS